MGAKIYFTNQFKKRMLFLKHDRVTDFYVSSVQNSRSAFPLLCLRSLLFLSCIGILLWSAILTGNSLGFKFWPIYFTHWGLVIITICSGFAWLVSLMAYLQGSLDADFGLPWYVKAYWICYNVAIPISFFITIFYYSFLTAVDEEFAIDPVLDVFIHAINAVLMLCMLLTSRQPSHILHFYWPLIVTLTYLVFTIIYHFTGGLNPKGEAWIYPNIDWATPGPTTGMVVASAVMLIIVHFVVVGLSLCRNWCTRRYIEDNRNMHLAY